MDTKKPDLAERRERAATEGRKALAEYEAHGVAARKNMERLKALRLQKEAAERAELLANPPPPKKAAAKKKKAKVVAEADPDESEAGED